MLATTLSLLSLLTAASATLHKSPHHRRAQYNPDPVAPGDPENGWPQLPETTGASIVQSTVGNYKFVRYYDAKDSFVI